VSLVELDVDDIEHLGITEKTVVTAEEAWKANGGPHELLYRGVSEALGNKNS
jgi:hypothetical protein